MENGFTYNHAFYFVQIFAHRFDRELVAGLYDGDDGMRSAIADLMTFGLVQYTGDHGPSDIGNKVFGSYLADHNRDIEIAKLSFLLDIGRDQFDARVQRGHYANNPEYTFSIVALNRLKLVHYNGRHSMSASGSALTAPLLDLMNDAE